MEHGRHLLLLLAAAIVHSVDASSARYSLDLTGIDTGSDTGSSNDAVLGADCCGSDAMVTFDCGASPTCSITDTTDYTLTFAGATIVGQFATDEWSSSEIDSITKSFLVIEQQDTFYRSTYDGITGLAYKAIAVPDSDSAPSSFYEDLVTNGDTSDAFGMLLCGIMQPLLMQETDFSLHAGQLLVGGIDGTEGETYFSGDMLYAPIVREAWFVVTVSDIGYDNKSLDLDCVQYNEPQAIIDSGTSNLAFPSDVYNALMTQIQEATLAAIPDFNTDYFDSDNSCCDEDYCDPSSTTSALLDLPSIYVSFALQTGDDVSDTTQHFTVEIPPEYYWRPEMNGENADTPCRAIGISESTSVVLGDVFMDGLYTYHNREESKIGIAVADNCPNNVTSTKKVYTSDSTIDWCSCFSSTLKKHNRISSYFPWGSACFFWLWWMYIVLASVVVVFISIGVIIYWRKSNKKMKQLQEELAAVSRAAPRELNRGTMGPALVPTLPPEGYNKKEQELATGSRRAPPSHLPPPPATVVSEAPFALMSSPQSDASSIALLSPPRSSSFSANRSIKNKKQKQTQASPSSARQRLRSSSLSGEFL